MFDVVGGLVVNDLPSSGKCAAIPHSKHQPLQPTERIKAHNHRSSQGGTVIGKEHDPHPLANSSITKDFPQVFYYAEAPGNGSDSGILGESPGNGSAGLGSFTMKHHETRNTMKCHLVAVEGL